MCPCKKTVTCQSVPSTSHILTKRLEINYKTQLQLLHDDPVVACWAATYFTQPQLQLLRNDSVAVFSAATYPTQPSDIWSPAAKWKVGSLHV